MSVGRTVPTPTLRHLARLSDDRGTFEHARLDAPRPDCGYCTDDAGRLLAVASRLPSDPDAARLADLNLAFLERAHQAAGQFHLRMSAAGSWTADPPSDDAAGRALLGLGVAAAGAPWAEVRRRARALFDQAVAFRSPFPRATAYAALGAVEVLGAYPDHDGARRFVVDAAASLPGPSPDPEWPWPEPRLAYANALLPEAALAVASCLRRSEQAEAAFDLLDWLVAVETQGDRFSFTPVGGRGPDGPSPPAFDQQPIEAWAMADACARAFRLTGAARWRRHLRRAAEWFLGHNDRGLVMHDPRTGGGFDGLREDGVNANQGAESTLAFVATILQLRSIPGWDEPSAADAVGQAAASSASSRCVTDAVAAPTHRSAAP